MHSSIIDCIVKSPLPGSSVQPPPRVAPATRDSSLTTTTGANPGQPATTRPMGPCPQWRRRSPGGLPGPRPGHTNRMRLTCDCKIVVRIVARPPLQACDLRLFRCWEVVARAADIGCAAVRRPASVGATSHEIASENRRKPVGATRAARSYLRGAPVGRRGRGGGSVVPGVSLAAPFG